MRKWPKRALGKFANIGHNGSTWQRRRGRLLLPNFTSDPPPNAVLPPGDYTLTLAELRQSMLVVGPRPLVPGWDASWRRDLIDRLAVRVANLKLIGITELFLAGSFVQNNPVPGDIDGYYMVDPAMWLRVQRPRLMTVDPLLATMFDKNTWVYSPEKGEPRPQLWHVARLELFYVLNTPANKFPGAIPQYFRRSRQDKPKGLIRIIL